MKILRIRKQKEQNKSNMRKLGDERGEGRRKEPGKSTC